MKGLVATDQVGPDGARWSSRLAATVSSVIGGISGLVPHVLHHIGPIAGTAILTGTEGSVLFGAIGFVLTVPLLLRLKKRFGTWLAPGIALALFIVMFAISTLWIGPAIRGDDAAAGVDPHHGARLQGTLSYAE